MLCRSNVNMRSRRPCVSGWRFSGFRSRAALLCKHSVTIALLLFAGRCVVAQSAETLPTVGPTESTPVGTLIVYSSTERFDDGDTIYYTHTNYKLYSPRGSFLRTVQNSIAKGDETPERVPLPPGQYVVEAKSRKLGIVRVPVMIADGRTTVVNLQSDRGRAGIAVLP